MSAEPHGPAYRAGVRSGDFILALNRQAVQYVDDLHRGLSESPFGGAGAARAAAKDEEDGAGSDAGGD
jgi:S1-C subfamily serine protease